MLGLLACSFWSCAAQIEIQFEPMGPQSMDETDQFLKMLSGGDTGQASSSKDSKEAQLDKLLSGALGQALQPRSNPRRHRSVFGSPFGPFGGGGGGGPVIIEEGSDPMSQIMGGGGGMSPFMVQRQSSGIPVDVIRDLFPGPHMFGRRSEHPTPFDEPDPLVQNLMSGLDGTFASLIGEMSKMASKDRTPNSCKQDIKTNCEGAKSQLHCLGEHADQISDQCHKDIGKSVPFRCSSSIEKYCNVLEVGILACLGEHLSDLGTECRDAVLATHHVITKANTHQATLMDWVAGVKTKVNEPSVAVTPPPPIQGLGQLELPKSVRDLLGEDRTGAGDKSWGSSKLLFLALCIIVVVVVVRSDPWLIYASHKKLRGLFIAPRKEDEPFIKDSGSNMPNIISAGDTRGNSTVRKTVELPVPVDLA
jgi:hypothetical protein